MDGPADVTRAELFLLFLRCLDAASIVALVTFSQVSFSLSSTIRAETVASNFSSMDDRNIVRASSRGIGASIDSRRSKSHVNLSM
jgi:hypothetical protein